MTSIYHDLIRHGRTDPAKMLDTLLIASLCDNWADVSAKAGLAHADSARRRVMELENRLGLPLYERKHTRGADAGKLIRLTICGKLVVYYWERMRHVYLTD
jgi:hypothetical protein